jgi:hypothetical protein
LGRYIRKYGIDLFTFDHVACAFDEQSLSELEEILITQYDTFKNGCNLTTGGQKRFGFSDETRALMSQRMTGRVKSEETMAKHRAYRPSPEARAKMSATRTGRKLSPEHIKKSAEGRRGYVPTLETKMKIAESKKNMSPESRKRMSDAQKGKKRDPVVVEKTASQLRGRKKAPRTPEHCKAISVAKLAASAIRGKVTHCPQGHPYAGDNLLGGRHGHCKTCQRERSRRDRARAAEQRAVARLILAHGSVARQPRKWQGSPAHSGQRMAEGDAAQIVRQGWPLDDDLTEPPAATTPLLDF